MSSRFSVTAPRSVSDRSNPPFCCSRTIPASLCNCRTFPSTNRSSARTVSPTSLLYKEIPIASSTPPFAPNTSARFTPKQVLWTTIALASLFVLLFYEVPILNPNGPWQVYRTHLLTEQPSLIPHIILGTLAFLIGPLQFSTRLRRRSLRLHRLLGRTYVYCVFLSAILAMFMALGTPLILAVWTHALVWIACTFAALLTARNRQIVQHRQWMIRSYAVTFSFFALRLAKPWQTHQNVSPVALSSEVIIVTFLCVMLPDIAFNWRELTRKRA